MQMVFHCLMKRWMRFVRTLRRRLSQVTCVCACESGNGGQCCVWWGWA